MPIKINVTLLCEANTLYRVAGLNPHTIRNVTLKSRNLLPTKAEGRSPGTVDLAVFQLDTRLGAISLPMNPERVNKSSEPIFASRQTDLMSGGENT